MADDVETKQKKRRNIAIALGVTAFVVLVYAVTILRLSGNVAGAS